MEENEKITALLNNFDVEKENIYKKVIPTVQELIVEQLRPDEKDLLKWKTSSRGRFDFRDYLNSRSCKNFSEVHLDALWRYYLGNVNVQRSKLIIEQYKLLNKRNENCAHCSSIENLQVDHKIPLVKGGLDTIENLQFLCGTCNLEKHGRYDYKELII
ncbi:5-methylcytosine-specific restriction endonuclease McrA [Planomicrobium stackebrandtii]|uniref:5-methylcytosine-specific restriction endonuclease McrA n=1 Tax=Planomicrobium stackebrandtii TaxID=253160 RepID=A0ABU0GVS6_9BACL|nr:HNH endonuclease signature motif containing protein [Planomicrobium stackebrandtii]MDQ0429418.1 5-methylcytosine-specific restriction endonuclease McrA [Planomicrobium stackebrandtii]